MRKREREGRREPAGERGREGGSWLVREGGKEGSGGTRWREEEGMCRLGEIQDIVYAWL